MNMPKIQYFVRNNRESFISMVSSHEAPFSSYNTALEDAQEAVTEGELDGDSIEIVRVVIEETFHVKLKAKK